MEKVWNISWVMQKTWRDDENCYYFIYFSSILAVYRLKIEFAR